MNCHQIADVDTCSGLLYFHHSFITGHSQSKQFAVCYRFGRVWDN